MKDVPRVNVPGNSVRVKVPLNAPTDLVLRVNVPESVPIPVADVISNLGISTVPKPRVDGDGDKDPAGDIASPAIADHGFTGPA